MGIFDWAQAALPVINSQRMANSQGQMDAYLFQRKREEEDRQAQRDALQQQLLQLQIAKAQQPDAWQPTDEASYMRVHPHNAPTTENIDPLSEAGISASLKRRRGEAAIDRQYPKPPSETEQSQSAVGDSILSSMNNRHDAIASPFAHAYAQVLAKHPKWDSGQAAYAAMQGTRAAHPELFREESKGSGLAAKYGTAGGVAPDSLPTPPVTPPPVTPPASATIPADPHQQEAMAQRWDELTSGGMDPEQAKQQVLREFGGQ